MSIISLGSITTPTFAEDEEKMYAAVQSVIKNQQETRSQQNDIVKNQKCVAQCGDNFVTLDKIVGTGDTEEDSAKDWIKQAGNYLAQYCSKKMIGYQCGTQKNQKNNKHYYVLQNYICEEYCEIEGCSNSNNKATQRQIDGTTICAFSKYQKNDPNAEAGNATLVETIADGNKFITRLKGSKATTTTPITKEKQQAQIVTETPPAQPTASITGKVVDEETDEPLYQATVQLFNQGTWLTGTTTDLDGIFIFSNHEWQNGYRITISYVGYADTEQKTEPNVDTPIQMKEGQELEEFVSENKNTGNDCCVQNTCENCKRTCTCSGTDDNYKCENYDGVWENVNGKLACKPNRCIQDWYEPKRHTEPATTEHEAYDYYICELTKSKRGDPCKSEIKNFDPHATDGTIVEWDPETDNKTCNPTDCKKEFELFDTNETYTDENNQTKKIQRCKQTTCPKNLIDQYKKKNENTKKYAKEWIVSEVDSDTYEATRCEVIECDSANGWEPSKKDPTTCVQINKCDCGKHWEWKDENDNPTEKCVPDNGKTDCVEDKIGVRTAFYGCNAKKKTICIIEDCLDGWILHTDPNNPEKNTCINQRDCLNWGKEQDKTQHTNKYEHATVASWDKTHENCTITACDKYYMVDKSANKCVQKNTEDQGKLQANLDKAKANEKSLENRITGAVGIGGVGIGGMMIGGALSERAADDYAESDMAAYINTFMCDYGDGNTVRGGQTNVEIPGGNELIDLYARYARLANDLKLRKESLGIKPGIESDVIIDKASTGLYDDVGTGVVGGGYASIARAIMNPNGPDAQMWAAQRAATTSKLNTGIGIATTAAAASLAGNILNKLREPKPFTIIQPEKQPNLDCAQFNNPEAGYTLKGEYPHCECVVSDDKALENELVFNFDNNTCYKCEGDEKLIDYNGVKQCRCPEETPYGDYNTHRCYANPPTCEQRGYNTKDIPHLYFDANKNCKPDCTDDFSYNEDSHICECKSPREEINGKCTSVVYSHTQETIERNKTDVETDALSNDTLFELGKHTFKNENGDNGKKAQQTIQDWFETNIANKKYKDCELSVVGHADTSGKNRNYDNKGLSERRAATVKTYLESQRNEKWLKPYLDPNVEIKSSGEGEQYCYCCKEDPNTCPSKSNNGSSITKCDPDITKHITTDQVYAPCRRVEIKAKCRLITKEETTTSQTTITQ